MSDIIDDDPLVTAEEAASFAEEADVFLQQPTESADVEREISRLLAEPSAAILKARARAEANMWNQQIFELRVRDMAAPGSNADSLQNLEKLLEFLAEKYDVAPDDMPKDLQLGIIEVEMKRVADTLPTLLVRAESLAYVKNENMLHATTKQIELLRMGARKMIALKHRVRNPA